MKKINLNLLRKHRWKSFLSFKITFLIFLINIFSAFGLRSSSQEYKVTIVIKDATIVDVLEKLRVSSNVNILYSVDELDTSKPVSVNVKDASVEEVLDRVLKGQHVGYVRKGDKIIISRKRYVKPLVGQQEFIELKGRVTDVSGQSIPGVNIFVKGTTVGTITDVGGNYLLNVPIQLN